MAEIPVIDEGSGCEGRHHGLKGEINRLFGSRHHVDEGLAFFADVDTKPASGLNVVRATADLKILRAWNQRPSTCATGSSPPQMPPARRTVLSVIVHRQTAPPNWLVASFGVMPERSQ